MHETEPSFTYELIEIQENVYRIAMPTVTGFEGLNAYLVRGAERSLLVDSGYDSPRTKAALDAALGETNVDWSCVDVVITHSHGEHLNGLNQIWRPGMRVYSSMRSIFDAREILERRYRSFTPCFMKALLKHGAEESLFDEKEITVSAPHTYIPITTVKDGDVITVGDFCLNVIEAPGHDRYQICLHDEAKGIMFSGDHVLGDVTSSLYASGFEEEMGLFLSSLDKLKKYNPDVILPGHGKPFYDLRTRVEATATKNLRNVERVYELVKDGHSELMDICRARTMQSRMPWESRTAANQWRVLCETVGYLGYLEEVGAIQRHDENETYLFFPLKRTL